ncbi:hypothetical protein TIFTF001_036620 [Ficus carica]|uniref:Uncharacterized protein n=1 Tax=Ficus carica TaxID=3494 RepID=A0AA88E4S1_FICCA|nr:hypothetical protein TIFTF001_036616 [Ficus carica]GMN67560.1 hypothetical protein TIFTF001_036620 [Ficus carica]
MDGIGNDDGDGSSRQEEKSSRQRRELQSLKTTELHFLQMQIQTPNTIPKFKPFQSQKQPNNRKKVRERNKTLPNADLEGSKSGGEQPASGGARCQLVQRRRCYRSIETLTQLPWVKLRSIVSRFSRRRSSGSAVATPMSGVRVEIRDVGGEESSRGKTNLVVENEAPGGDQSWSSEGRETEEEKEQRGLSRVGEREGKERERVEERE